MTSGIVQHCSPTHHIRVTELELSIFIDVRSTGDTRGYDDSTILKKWTFHNRFTLFSLLSYLIIFKYSSLKTLGVIFVFLINIYFYLSWLYCTHVLDLSWICFRRHFAWLHEQKFHFLSWVFSTFKWWSYHGQERTRKWIFYFEKSICVSSLYLYRYSFTCTHFGNHLSSHQNR